MFMTCSSIFNWTGSSCCHASEPHYMCVSQEFKQEPHMDGYHNVLFTVLTKMTQTPIFQSTSIWLQIQDTFQ